MAKAIAVILFLIGLGYAGYLGCVSCISVDGADLSERPCSPVLSNGDTNPHYRNSWYACRRKCGGQGQYPTLDVSTCRCGCM